MIRILYYPIIEGYNILLHFTFHSLTVKAAPFSFYSMAEMSNQNNQIRGRQKESGTSAGKPETVI